MSRGHLDLDRESRVSLEFDEVLELVAGHAATGMGRARVRASAPSTDSGWIAEQQATVAEARSYLATHGRMIPAGLPDPGVAVQALRATQPQVSALELADLARVLLVADDLAGSLERLRSEEFPALHRLGSALPDLATESEAVVRNVSPEGRVEDGASPELRHVRRAIARLNQRLRRELERLVRDPGPGSVVRDDFVTQRNGRYVIPVRADAHRPLEGIVHAASSSGATLFVEPLATVASNNELIRLAEAEAEEERRVILGWALSFRDRLEEVDRAIETLIVADTLQARASFGRREHASAPELLGEGGFELVAGRHPLLDQRLAERGQRAVPLDLRLSPPHAVLLLSGPNTGGKTVALKILGLSVLMAQSGIPVCASRAKLPIVKQVRADIGDHQSISADLSTFSAHVQAVSRFLAEVDPPALFLFDEIGTGTEPHEGAALAQAVLEALAVSGALTMATTHLGALKAWAFTDPAASCAAMEFDMATLQPTFRVLEDVAGSSAGLEIASRLRLQPTVVERARALLDAESRQSESYLARLRERIGEVEAERNELIEARAVLDQTERDLVERETRAKERRSREADRALDHALEQFARNARRELAGLSDAKERSRMAKRVERATARLRGQTQEHRGSLAGGKGEETLPVAPPHELRPGLAVRVRSLGREGEVLAIHAGQVQVRLGNSMFTVAREDLSLLQTAAKPPARSGGVRLERPGAAEGGARELKLLGRRVDEALDALDKWLDDAVLSGLGEVRVIHGHGTGRLRAAVREFLDAHPAVRRHRPGRSGEGGDGATVVSLVDA